MTIADDPQRLIIAAFAIVVYAVLCLMIFYAQAARRRGAALMPTAGTGHLWHVAYASQTGTSEELARQTAHTLQLSGSAVQMAELSTFDASALAGAERILFIVSTYGEGNPPDNAAVFAQRVMGATKGVTASLGHLHYAVLALGDRGYTNYCGFGHDLDRWLQALGAQSLAPLIEVDQCDAKAIEAWRQQLSHLTGTDDAPDWQGPAYEPWQLVRRELLNVGSAGDEVFQLELVPATDASLPDWESGDLVQVVTPGDPGRPREYSIASIPHEGSIHLLVRLHRHADGTLGAASGWLTGQVEPGASVPLRLRRHPRFRLGDNARRPLILIGNGTGIAGLRGHLKSRAMAGTVDNWLIFGERNARYDFHYRNEIDAWCAAGVLQRTDVVFSRDQPERIYVQDRLLQESDAVRDWVARGAAIYVCGSLKGMAGGVDDALTRMLGRAELESLTLAGRYRRDVY